MPNTRVGEHELYYEVQGDGPGRPAVLLMGLGSDIGAWERVAPVLGRSRRLLLVENRGVGRSAKPKGPYTMAELAGDAVAVMGAAGFEHAHVVGISLGGAIAQEVALTHPSIVRSLTLIATFAALDSKMRATGEAGASSVTRGTAKDLLRALQTMGDGIDPKAIFGFLMPLVFTPAFLEKERDLLKRLFMQSMAHGLSLDGFAGQLAAAWGHDTRERLPSLRVPTLVVTGTADKLVPPAQSKMIHELIAGSGYREIPGGVHGLVLEGAEELAPMLEEWLKEND